MENSEEKNLDVKDTMQDKAYKVIKKCKEIAEKDFTKFSALFVAVMTVGLWVIKGMWYAYQSGRFSVYGIASCYITSDDESFLLQIIQLAAVLIVWFGINYLFYTILVSEDETKYHWKRKLKSVVFWIVEMLLLLIMVLITSRVISIPPITSHPSCMQPFVLSIYGRPKLMELVSKKSPLHTYLVLLNPSGRIFSFVE